MKAQAKSEKRRPAKNQINLVNSPADDEATLRRLMYERIARGHALAEVEDHAHRLRH